MLSTSKCIVTGASSGIGKATCKVLTAHGAAVIGTGRNETSLSQLKEEGQIIDYILADLTSLENKNCQEVVEEAVRLLGGSLTSLINGAGVLLGGAMGDSNVNMENYNLNMSTNVQVPFELMLHCIPYLRRSTSSSCSIVNVSSVNGKQAFPGCVTYCMSKAALDQLTKCSSVDLAKDGIRVNSVNPGVIETNLHKTSGLNCEQYAEFLERSIQVTHPIAKSLGRVGQPEEVGELIAFLISDKAKFITGECIAIDGGRQNLGAR